jgi:acyl-CoA thioesterase-1
MSNLAKGLLAASLMALSIASSHAQVVALGASNTAGKGVGSSSAYPAQLESILRAKEGRCP